MVEPKRAVIFKIGMFEASVFLEIMIEPESAPRLGFGMVTLLIENRRHIRIGAFGFFWIFFLIDFHMYEVVGRHLNAEKGEQRVGNPSITVAQFQLLRAKEKPGNAFALRR